LGKTSHIATFNNTPSLEDDVNSSGSSPNISTRDFDFGSPGVKKKVYKVYLTYRFQTGSGIKPQYSINGVDTRYDFDNTALSSSTSWNTVELKPASSSQVNGIFSIQVHLSQEDGAAVPTGFEINDITVVYRLKNIK
jgi:hypothetical protein